MKSILKPQEETITAEQTLKKFCGFKESSKKYDKDKLIDISKVLYRCLDNGLLTYRKDITGALIPNSERYISSLKACLNVMIPAEKEVFFINGKEELHSRKTHIPPCFKNPHFDKHGRETLLTRDDYWTTTSGRKQLLSLTDLFKVDELVEAISNKTTLTKEQCLKILLGRRYKANSKQQETLTPVSNKETVNNIEKSVTDEKQAKKQQFEKKIESIKTVIYDLTEDLNIPYEYQEEWEMEKTLAYAKMLLEKEGIILKQGKFENSGKVQRVTGIKSRQTFRDILKLAFL